jgi:heme A synthase
MATSHADAVVAERDGPFRELGCMVRGHAAIVPESEENLTADATNRRRIAHFPRVGVSVVTVATFAALVLGKRTALRGGRISSRQVR